MAISLGSLYVELKANTGAFVEGLSKAAVNSRAFGKDVESSLGKIGSLFAPLGEMGQKLAAIFDTVGGSARSAFADIGRSGPLVGGLAALTGGAAALGGTMFALADRSAEVGNQIYEASKKTGIGAAQMSGLMAITKETGGDFNALTVSLARAGANLENAIINPGGKVGKVLVGVMGSMKALTDEGAKPMGDRLQDVIKHTMALSDVGERNLALSALLGRGWMENVESLKILAEQGYGPAIAQAQNFGFFFSDEGAKQAAKFEVALRQTRAEFSALALTLGQSVIPAFSKLIVMMQGTGTIAREVGLRMLAIREAMTVVGIPTAIKIWKEANEKGKESTQIMTDFVAKLDGLMDGEKYAADAGNALTSGIRAHSDALANLIEREREQLALANADGNAALRLGAEYQHTVEEIQKLVAAGASQKEALGALGLAWDLYYKKMQGVGGRPHTLMVEPPPGPPPLAQFPLGGQSVPNAPIPQIATPAEWAILRGNMGGMASAAKALAKEEDLSATSLTRLSAAFKGLDMEQIAAMASGRRLIEQFAKMDKLGTFSDQFKDMIDNLILEGDNFGGKFLATMTQTLDQVENKFAQLATHGKANFRELLPQMEQGLVKGGLQTGVSMFLKGTGFGGGDKLGTVGNPMHVIMDSLSGQTAGLSGFASMASSIEHGIGGVFSKLFGGFMAEGGDVGAGHGYIVGEHGPEFFLPRVHGSIAPQGVGGGAAVINVQMHVHGVADADSFRRSSSQIMADLHRQSAIALSRTR